MAKNIDFFDPVTKNYGIFGPSGKNMDFFDHSQISQKSSVSAVPAPPPQRFLQRQTPTTVKKKAKLPNGKVLRLFPWNDESIEAGLNLKGSKQRGFSTLYNTPFQLSRLQRIV